MSVKIQSPDTVFGHPGALWGYYLSTPTRRLFSRISGNPDVRISGYPAIRLIRIAGYVEYPTGYVEYPMLFA